MGQSASLQLWSKGRNGMAWMRACISALAEDIAASPRAAAKPQCLVAADETGLEAFDKSGASLGRDPARFSAGIGKAHALLRVGAGRAVVKRIKLPESARDVLAAVVRNKVEGLAPWPLAESLWGHRLAGEAAAGQIAVDVGIVSRRAAEGFVAVLADARVAVASLEIGDGIPVDFRRAERASAIRRRMKHGLAGAGIVACAIAACGGFLAWSAEAESAALAARLAEVKRGLFGARDSAGDPRLAAANALLERKKAEPPLIAVLAELTARVPDTAWLEAIDVDHGKLRISGRGADTSAVVESLESSPSFSGAGFAAATERDAETGADAFAISALIEGAEVKP